MQGNGAHLLLASNLPAGLLSTTLFSTSVAPSSCEGRHERSASMPAPHPQILQELAVSDARFLGHCTTHVCPALQQIAHVPFCWHCQSGCCMTKLWRAYHFTGVWLHPQDCVACYLAVLQNPCAPVHHTQCIPVQHNAYTSTGSSAACQVDCQRPENKDLPCCKGKTTDPRQAAAVN